MKKDLWFIKYDTVTGLFEPLNSSVIGPFDSDTDATQSGFVLFGKNFNVFPIEVEAA